jgi:hypothetical protein
MIKQKKQNAMIPFVRGRVPSERRVVSLIIKVRITITYELGHLLSIVQFAHKTL